MALRTQTWRPDTCDCVIVQEWDDSLPQDQIVINPISINRCAAHQNIQSTVTASNTVLSENQNKNFGLDEILQNAPNTNWFDIDAQTGSRVFKKNIILNWTWSGTPPNRVLTLNFTGVSLTAQQKNTLQTRLNNRFGTGKIVIA
jgi:hypothetical protein